MSDLNNTENNMSIRLETLGKIEARKLMAAHEQAGTLKQYVEKNYPDCITPDGRVAVFTIVKKFGLV